MHLSLPFLQARFHELDHLPADDQQAILQRCVAAPSVERLNHRRLWSLRGVILLLPVGIALSVFGQVTGRHVVVIGWAMFGIIITVLVAFPALFLWYWFRIVAEMHRLVRQEVANNPSYAKYGQGNEQTG